MCQTVVRFDVRGVSASSIPTVRFTWASGDYWDTLVATQSTSSGSATNSTYGSVSYTYTTTATTPAVVRSYVATVAADVGVGTQMTFWARADVPTGDSDEVSITLPVQVGTC